MPSAKKTADDYAADLYANVDGNQNRLEKIMVDGLLPEMVTALMRALPDPKVSTPAIERALEKWRTETDPPLWSKKIGDTSIRTYRKNKHGIA